MHRATTIQPKNSKHRRVLAASAMSLLLLASACSDTGKTPASDATVAARDHKKRVPPGSTTPPTNTTTSSTTPLDPLTQPKFVNSLPIPGIISPNVAGGFAQYDIAMTQFQQDLGLVDPGTGQSLRTTVWGYGGRYPGPTIETRSTSPENSVNPGLPVKVRWSNQLPSTHLLPVDTTLMCGANAPNCQPTVRTVPHLHGGHTDAGSDGHPDAWFTANFRQTGSTFDPSIGGAYTYRNDQGATALWYHDHAMSMTRLNVYAGLAGFYFIRDDNEDRLRQTQQLPDLKYEIPLMIQDKTFYTDGALAYPGAPFLDANGNPITRDPITGAPVASVLPEYFGDTILVNGKTWPVLDVEPRRYRFRVLNGSNSRFYNLTLEATPGAAIGFNQIGSDGGFLNSPAQMTSLLLGPAERADLIVDFSDIALAGKTIIVKNNANAPYPTGAAPDPATTGQIMAFRVSRPLDTTVPLAVQPTQLRSRQIPELNAPRGTPPRELLLVESVDSLGRLLPQLGTSAGGPFMWADPVTETPKLGSTEVWSIINTTPDTHPIHQHLVQFQILDRTPFDTAAYIPGQPATLRLIGRGQRPARNESGLKDTAQARPGEVIRLIAKYDLLGDYVWHCHILEHEDHEMMRPFRVVP